jgi:hypothetical protein
MQNEHWVLQRRSAPNYPRHARFMPDIHALAAK